MSEESRTFVIWSFEHNAWWRPGRCGYTPHLPHAGRYTHADADEIVTNANRYAKEVEEQAIPLRVALEHEARGWHRLTPGTYDDGQGGLHIVVSELLAGQGYADTPDNRATLIAGIREAFQVVEVIH
jgi:hypothetical protein